MLCIGDYWTIGQESGCGTCLCIGRATLFLGCPHSAAGLEQSSVRLYGEATIMVFRFLFWMHQAECERVRFILRT